jgi:hypothetical protein
MNLFMFYISIVLLSLHPIQCIEWSIHFWTHHVSGSGFVSSLLFPSYVGKSAFSWDDQPWWWRHRTDVKHDAIIFLSSSLFQSTCICQTGVLFCCVSTFALKHHTDVSNRRRCLWIPMWEHEADDFYYNSVSPSLRLSVSPSLRLSVPPSLRLSVSPSLRLSVSHTSNETPHMFAHSLTLQNFLTFGSHFTAYLFSCFLTKENLKFCQRCIVC